MNTPTGRKFRMSKISICLLALCLMVSFISISFAGTTQVIYEGRNMQMQLGSSLQYELEIGPLNVAKRAQIRVNTFPGESVSSGNISVQVLNTNGAGEILGLLDSLTIDLASPESIYLTRVYDVPGSYLKFIFHSASANSVSLVIFGR
jgi:hypothetical protein